MPHKVDTRSALQKLLDGFLCSRKSLVTWIAYLSARLYGSEPTWKELYDGSFPSREHHDFNLDRVGDIDGVLEEAKQGLRNAEARQASVADKCKTLLTLASLLVGLVGVLLLKEPTEEPLWLRVLFFISMLTLLNAVTLICLIFEVKFGMKVVVDEDEANLPNLDFKKCLTNLYRKCQVDQENKNDFLVEIYKVARFFFLSAFTLLVLEFAIGFFLVSPDSLAKETAKELRSDSTFLSSVRGEKGDTGPKGEPGAKGDQGPKGDKGDPTAKTP
jgi:hypothetical protein